VMIKYALLGFLAWSFLSTSQAATADLRNEKAATLREGGVRLLVNVGQSRADEECRSANSWRWGVEQACPAKIISSITLEFRGKQVFVPYSAFSDLGNPASISVELDPTGNKYSIKILGGDAATSYVALLKFKSDVLLEKIVRHGEFPDGAWEKTVYKFNIAQ
jgi:hypothetical protein